MKGFKITDINFHQAVTLPAGVYTYSCKATPVGSSITFRVGSTDYVIDSLTPGVYQKGIKKTFTIETDQSYFYPSRTVGDEIFEPQLEEGTVATTAGPHILDASEEVSRAGIEINDEMVRTYATKVDVSSEIIQTAESINTRVSNAEGRIGAVEVAADSINTRVSNAEGWIGAVEVTPASINSSVTKSGQIASQILQEDGTVKISAEQIELEGSQTAGENFVVTIDGTVKMKGAEIEGALIAKDATGIKIATMNEAGDGAYIQYYPNGKKQMEFGGGEITYYNNDAGNTVKWVLGEAGYGTSYQSLDRWVSRYLVATDTNGLGVKLSYIEGHEYKTFSAGSPSANTAFNGLTVPGSKASAGTSPASILTSDYLNGWYAKPGIAFMDQDLPSGTYTRQLYYFTDGKQTSSKIVTWTNN